MSYIIDDDETRIQDMQARIDELAIQTFSSAVVGRNESTRHTGIQSGDGAATNPYPLWMPIRNFGELGNLTIDIRLSQVNSHVAKMTLNGDTNFAFSEPPPTNKMIQFVLDVTIDGTGGYTINLPGNLEPGTIVIDNTANARTILLIQTTDGGVTFQAQNILDTGGGGGGPFLPTPGGSMIGPIAFFPQLAPTLSNHRLDITQATGAFSSYVLVGQTDYVKFIDGAAFNGQELTIEGVSFSSLELKTATLPLITRIEGVGSQIVDVEVESTVNILDGDEVNITGTVNYDEDKVIVFNVTANAFSYTSAAPTSTVIDTAGRVQDGNILIDNGTNITLTATLLGLPIVELIFDNAGTAFQGGWRNKSALAGTTGLLSNLTIDTNKNWEGQGINNFGPLTGVTGIDLDPDGDATIQGVGIVDFFQANQTIQNTGDTAGVIKSLGALGGDLTGYNEGEVIDLLFGTGTGATATAVISAGGVIQSITLINGGAGYAATDTLTIKGQSSLKQTATIPVATIAEGAITLFSTLVGGSGYTFGENITLSGGNGADAEATVNISGGVITSITLTNGGFGYLATDTLTIIGNISGANNATIEVGLVATGGLLYSVADTQFHIFRSGAVESARFSAELTLISSATTTVNSNVINLGQGIVATDVLNVLSKSIFGNNITLSDTIDILPFTNNGSDLGDNTHLFRNVFLSNIILQTSPSPPASTINSIFVQANSLVHNVPPGGNFDFREGATNFLVMDEDLVTFSSGNLTVNSPTINMGDGAGAGDRFNVLSQSAFAKNIILSDTVDILPFADLGSDLGSTTRAFGTAYINEIVFDVAGKTIDSAGALDLEFDIPSGGDMIFREAGTEFWRLDGGDNVSVFSRDIELDGTNRAIRAFDGTEIGFFVTNTSSSVGTEGTNQMPITPDTTPTAAELDVDFGDALGCFGLATLGGLPTTPLFVIKIGTGPSTWATLQLSVSGNVAAGRIT